MLKLSTKTQKKLYNRGFFTSSRQKQYFLFLTGSIQDLALATFYLEQNEQSEQTRIKLKKEVYQKIIEIMQKKPEEGKYEDEVLSNLASLKDIEGAKESIEKQFRDPALIDEKY